MKWVTCSKCGQRFRAEGPPVLSISGEPKTIREPKRLEGSTVATDATYEIEGLGRITLMCPARCGGRIRVTV